MMLPRMPVCAQAEWLARLNSGTITTSALRIGTRFLDRAMSHLPTFHVRELSACREEGEFRPQGSTWPDRTQRSIACEDQRVSLSWSSLLHAHMSQRLTLPAANVAGR